MSEIELIDGDAMALLPTMERESFDAAIVDPPYGETSLPWDSRLDWPSLVLPLLKPTGSLWCFGSMRMFLESMADFSGWKFAQDLVWEKQNGSGFHSDRFKRVHEHVLQFYPSTSPWGGVFKRPVKTADATRRTVRRKSRPGHTGNIEASSYESEDGGPRLMRSVLHGPNCHGFAIHPTQKPEWIIDPLLRYSVPIGGRIFDPFAGSGTTLVVARRLGLRATGIEIDPVMAEKARYRFRSELVLQERR